MSDKTETPSDVTTTVPADAEPAKLADGAGKEIPLEKLRDENIGDQNPDDIILANPQWGSVSMLANAASFDIVVPDVVAKANINQFWNVERNGLFSISNGGGSLLETFQQMFGIADDDGKKKDDEDNLSAISDAVHDQREEARRQQEEWDRSNHELGGVTMTGEEWGDLGEELHKDSPLRRSLIERLMKQGRTRQEAEKKATEIADTSTIMGKPETQWTPAEREKVERAKTDPAFTENAQWMKDFRQGTANGVSNDIEKGSSQSGQSDSTSIRDDVLSTPFPNAPKVQEEFQTAASGNVKIEAKPEVKIAAATPLPAAQPASSGGFDV